MVGYSTLIIAMVAIGFAIFAEGGHICESPFYTVNKLKKGNRFVITVMGKGANQEFLYNEHEDMTIYKGNGEVVIGNSVYAGRGWYNLNLYEAGYCYSYPSCGHSKEKMDRPECLELIETIRDAKERLFPILGTETVQSPNFNVQTKKNYKYVSHKIVGRGVLDVFVFEKTEPSTVTIKGAVLMIGERVFTDEFGKVYMKLDGKCVCRKYEQGVQIASIELSDQECKEAWNKREMAKTGKTMDVGNAPRDWKKAGNTVTANRRLNAGLQTAAAKTAGRPQTANNNRS